MRYPCLLLSAILFSHCVELEGVEPSSKQGNNMLSTCLFQTSFSCGSKTWTTNRRLSLIRFYRMPETDRRLSPIFLHRYIRRFGTRDRKSTRLNSSHSQQYLVCRLLLEKNFFNDTATTEIYTLSLHDALPICSVCGCLPQQGRPFTRRVYFAEKGTLHLVGSKSAQIGRAHV